MSFDSSYDLTQKIDDKSAVRESASRLMEEGAGIRVSKREAVCGSEATRVGV